MPVCLAESGVALDFGFGAAVSLEALLPVGALLVQSFQAGGGFASDQLLAQGAQFLGAAVARSQGLGLLVQLALQLGQYGLFEDFRQAVAQCLHGLALLLGAEAGVVLDAQAVEGELVVGLFLGEERLVSHLAEQSGAQCADGLLALTNAIQMSQLWQVAFQVDQLAFVIEVLLKQLQGLAFGRLRQLRGDIALQAFDAGLEWLFAEAAEEVVEKVANLRLR